MVANGGRFQAAILAPSPSVTPQVTSPVAKAPMNPSTRNLSPIATAQATPTSKSTDQKDSKNSSRKLHRKIGNVPQSLTFHLWIKPNRQHKQESVYSTSLMVLMAMGGMPYLHLNWIERESMWKIWKSSYIEIFSMHSNEKKSRRREHSL